METRNERDSIRLAIRALLEKDLGTGALNPLPHYKQLFPGFWDLVVEEYRLVDSVPGEAPLPDSAAPTRMGTAVVDDRPPAEEKPADRIGPYRILRELGRGGMGVVYEAEDTRLPRRVALKVLSPQFATSMQLRLRFQREAELASKLDHPHICTVYESGEDDGTPYLAMRYVAGRPLSDLVAEARAAEKKSSVVTLPVKGETPEKTGSGEAKHAVDRVLVLFEKVARALHAAHEKGLIHRDIKPHNVMVTAEGEPVLLDFGLAREEAGEGHQLTQTGSLMGTPAYMSPEQLMAAKLKLDRRTDVYSLGVSLYECLTLRLPFDAPTIDRLYQQILSTNPENPRKLNRALSEDLKVILETVLEKDRERRYQTAADLAEELRRVLDHEPIKARPPGNLYRALRFVQRNAQAVTGGVVASLCVGAILWTFLSARIGQTPETLVGIADELKAAGYGPAARIYYEKALEKGGWGEETWQDRRGAASGAPPVLVAISEGLVPLLLEDATTARARGDLEGALRILEKAHRLASAQDASSWWNIRVHRMGGVEAVNTMRAESGAPLWKVEQAFAGGILGTHSLTDPDLPRILATEVFPALGDPGHLELKETSEFLASGGLSYWLNWRELGAEPAVSPTSVVSVLRGCWRLDERRFATRIEKLREAVSALFARAPAETAGALLALAKDDALPPRERAAATGLLCLPFDLAPLTVVSQERVDEIVAVAAALPDLDRAASWRRRVAFAVREAEAGGAGAAAWLLQRTGRRGTPAEGWRAWWETRREAEPLDVILGELGEVPEGMSTDTALDRLYAAPRGEIQAWHTVLVLLSPREVTCPDCPAVDDDGKPPPPPPRLRQAWYEALRGRSGQRTVRIQGIGFLRDIEDRRPPATAWSGTAEVETGRVFGARVPDPATSPPGSTAVWAKELSQDEFGRYPERSDFSLFAEVTAEGKGGQFQELPPSWFYTNRRQTLSLPLPIVGRVEWKGNEGDGLFVRIMPEGEEPLPDRVDAWQAEASRALRAHLEEMGPLLGSGEAPGFEEFQARLIEVVRVLDQVEDLIGADLLPELRALAAGLTSDRTAPYDRRDPRLVRNFLLTIGFHRLILGDEEALEPLREQLRRTVPQGRNAPAVVGPLADKWALLARGGAPPSARSACLEAAMQSRWGGGLSDGPALLLLDAMDGGRCPENAAFRTYAEGMRRDLRWRAFHEGLDRWVLSRMSLVVAALAGLLALFNLGAALRPRAEPVDRLRPAWMLLLMGLLLVLLRPGADETSWYSWVQSMGIAGAAGAALVLLALHLLGRATRGWLPRLPSYLIVLSMTAAMVSVQSLSWEVEEVMPDVSLGLAVMAGVLLPRVISGLRLQAVVGKEGPEEASRLGRALGSDRALGISLLAVVVLSVIIPLTLRFTGVVGNRDEDEVVLFASIPAILWLLWALASLRHAIEMRVTRPSIPVRIRDWVRKRRRARTRSR